MTATPESQQHELPFPLRAMKLVLGAGKRVGLAKPMTRVAMGQILSEKTKQRAFAGYSPAKHDVFAATFAKSGTNWMMQIAQQIAHRGAAEFDHIHDLVIWPDAPGRPMGDLSDTSLAEASPTGLRVIKTHLETAWVPYSEQACYLTVIRDPKEVMVSSYHFLGGILGVITHLDIHDWYELTMRPGGLMDAWAVHTAGYWDWRDRANVFVVNYREVIKEPVASIAQVAKTMGVELSEDELAAVVERASFEWMSANDARFAPPGAGASGVKMVRRGEAGGSGELLSAAQQVAIDERAQAELARIGSSFPYADAFDLA